jgi:hypothetical protein
MILSLAVKNTLYQNDMRNIYIVKKDKGGTQQYDSTNPDLD